MMMSNVENLRSHHLEACIEYKSVLFKLKPCFFTGFATETVVVERNMPETCGLRRTVEKTLAHRMHSVK